MWSSRAGIGCLEVCLSMPHCKMLSAGHARRACRYDRILFQARLLPPLPASLSACHVVTMSASQRPLLPSFSEGLIHRLCDFSEIEEACAVLFFSSFDETSP